MFSDIEGSTRLLQRLGDRYADLLSTHRDLFRDACSPARRLRGRRAGRRVLRRLRFCHDAVAAAAYVQRALTTHAWPDGHEIRVRIGLQTGEPRLRRRPLRRARRPPRRARDGRRARRAGAGLGIDARAPRRPRCDFATSASTGSRTSPSRSTCTSSRSTACPPSSLRSTPSRTDRRICLRPRARSSGVSVSSPRWNRSCSAADLRLLTLTGPGEPEDAPRPPGRRADMIEHFSSGVFFVSLAPVTDPELVVPAVARALGLREYPGEPMLETLTDYVRDKELLLVLDNLEQVLAAAPASPDSSRRHPAFASWRRAGRRSTSPASRVRRSRRWRSPIRPGRRLVADLERSRP